MSFLRALCGATVVLLLSGCGDPSTTATPAPSPTPDPRYTPTYAQVVAEARYTNYCKELAKIVAASRSDGNASPLSANPISAQWQTDCNPLIKR